MPCIPGDTISWFVRCWERLLAIPMPVGPVPVPTSGPGYPAILFLELFKIVSYAAMPMPVEMVLTLTNGPAYPAILYLRLFRPGKGC